MTRICIHCSDLQNSNFLQQFFSSKLYDPLFCCTVHNIVSRNYFANSQPFVMYFTHSMSKPFFTHSMSKPFFFYSQGVRISELELFKQKVMYSYDNICLVFYRYVLPSRKDDYIYTVQTSGNRFCILQIKVSNNLLGKKNQPILFAGLNCTFLNTVLGIGSFYLH